MNPVFETLPGAEVAVGEIPRALARLWEGEAAAGQGAPSEFRASQMNLVLHFGLAATPADALAQFLVALRFAERYPCRLIALVPVAGLPARAAMQAKIDSQCYVGRSRREMVCTEAIVLAYPQDTRGFVADLVSTLVEADLPIYYWVHRFSSCRRLADYDYLLRAARRFVFDSAIAPDDALAYPWPRPEAFRDLAAARLLHVRQLLGQFLSGFPPEAIGRGLVAATVRYGAEMKAEARCLAAWTGSALARCAPGTVPLPPTVELAGELGAKELELRFGYGDARYFRWRADLAPGWAGFDADFGAGRVQHCAAVQLAAPEAALGEAFFF